MTERTVKRTPVHYTFEVYGLGDTQLVSDRFSSEELAVANFEKLKSVVKTSFGGALIEWSRFGIATKLRDL